MFYQLLHKCCLRKGSWHVFGVITFEEDPHSCSPQSHYQHSPRWDAVWTLHRFTSPAPLLSFWSNLFPLSLFLLLQQRSPGKVLFDLVCVHLNLTEGDYFGLEYQDQRKMTVRAVQKNTQKNLYPIISYVYILCHIYAEFLDFHSVFFFCTQGEFLTLEAMFRVQYFQKCNSQIHDVCFTVSIKSDWLNGTSTCHTFYNWRLGNIWKWWPWLIYESYYTLIILHFIAMHRPLLSNRSCHTGLGFSSLYITEKI